jgi:UDP-glucose 4-epimerase
VIDLVEKYLNPEVEFFKLDISDPRVLNVFKKEKPDIVYHLAGPINLRRQINDPLFSKSLNIFGGFKKILDYCREFKTKKVIFLSSGGAIYSNAKIIPTTEKYLAHPGSFYGLANLIFEKLLDEYYKSYKLNFIILRLSNVYGPRQWESGIIPSFIIKLLNKKKPVINGDGRQTRDFIYIDDVVKACLIFAKKRKRGIYNVGSGKEVTIYEIFTTIREILHSKIKPIYKNLMESGPRKSALDIQKIQKEFCWQPKINLKEGLAKTIEWFQKNGPR